MSKKIDLTGQKFGRLTVLKDINHKSRGVLWKCQCECGNIVEVLGSNLRRGNTKSCGCLQKERTSKANKKDLTNQKFGRLTALNGVNKNKHRNVLWSCLCECGSIINVTATHLLSGHTQSCGCYAKERLSETNRKDLTGQIFGRLTVLEDAGRTKQGKVIWRCLCECGNIVDVVGTDLSVGHTKSCGCLQKERTSEANSGEMCHWWKGGITPLYLAVRSCPQYKKWRTSVFQRDNFTCIHCNDSTGGNLIVHHIKLFSDIMEENHITTLEEAIQCKALWDVNNGITLCVECHKAEHRRLKALDIVEPM